MTKAQLVAHLEGPSHARRGKPTRFADPPARLFRDWLEAFHGRLHEEQERAMHRGPREHSA